MNSMLLKGKTALVTGAGRGIGKAIAIRLAEAGADVVINYNTSEDGAKETAEIVEGAGVKALVIKADVSNPEEVKEMFGRIKDEFGMVNILVNNAGILKDSLLLMMKDDMWDDVIDTNLKGPYLCMKYAVKMMMREKYGKIVNISSIIGRRGNAGQVNYAASKAGLIGMTYSAAKELGKMGIRVNAIAPGVIQTDMIAHLKDDYIEHLKEGIALGKLGTPEEVAEVVLFFASPASDYVTGQVIGVDGGQVI